MIRDTSVADLWVPCCWRPTLAWCRAWSGFACMHACMQYPRDLRSYLLGWELLEKIVVRHSRCWRPQVCAGLCGCCLVSSRLCALAYLCAVSELRSHGHWEGSHADSSLQLAMEAGMWVVSLYAWPSSHEQVTVTLFLATTTVKFVLSIIWWCPIPWNYPRGLRGKSTARALSFLCVCVFALARACGRRGWGSHATIIFHLPRIRPRCVWFVILICQVLLSVSLSKVKQLSRNYGLSDLCASTYSVLHVMGTG